MSERQQLPMGRAAIIDAHERLMTAHREHDAAHRDDAQHRYAEADKREGGEGWISTP